MLAAGGAPTEVVVVVLVVVVVVVRVIHVNTDVDVQDEVTQLSSGLGQASGHADTDRKRR